MVDDCHIKIDVNGQIFVVLHTDCRIEKEKILELLREAGIDVSIVTFLTPEEVYECDGLNDAPVLIPIDASVCDSPDLDQAGLHSGQAGGRVIILFGDAFPYERLHPIAEKYGTQCGWSAEQLGSCLGDGKPDELLSGTGAPIVRPSARQVKC